MKKICFCQTGVHAQMQTTVNRFRSCGDLGRIWGFNCELYFLKHDKFCFIIFSTG